MRKVEIGSNFKVKGIRGLYLNPNTGRYWVRYCSGNIDRQRSFAPSNVTFSGLERRAAVELRALKKEVEAELKSSPSSIKPKPNNAFDAVQELEKAIDTVYADRVTPHTYQKMKRHLQGYKLAKFEKTACEIDTFNRQHLLQKLASHTPSMQEECFAKVSTAFKKLITIGLHKGTNPCDFVKPPKKVTASREGFFAPSELMQVKEALTDEEAKLFFELCCVTGQRPVDVHRLNLENVTPCFKFYNSKTNRANRVACLIPDDIVTRCHVIKKWSRSQDTYSAIINETIRNLFGEDESRTLYHVRHSFLTNLRSMGNALEDCKLWTHAGSDAAELHYIHESQDRANTILIPYLQSLGYALENCG